MQTHLKLHDGTTIPALGLGTWKSEPNTVGAAVRHAVSTAGYRHIDCASIYRNEPEIGAALTDVLAGPITRQELFITSKLWNTEHDPSHVEAACRQTLKDLGLDYLDLYLMHWGVAFKHGKALESLRANGQVITANVPIQATWQAMETLIQKGLVKSIGVSNFTVPMLLDLLTYAKVKPVINQVELHPYLAQTELIDFCRSKDIAVTAYSPFAHEGPQLFDTGIVKELAAKYRKTVAQILLHWAVARGTVVIPKSTTPARISENIAVFDFTLTQDEIQAVTALNKNQRFVEPTGWWGLPYFV